MSRDYTIREEIIEVVNRLFINTDERNWDGMKKEVFAKEVVFDMTSMGAEKVEQLSSKQICEMWDEGLSGIDAVHHQAGTYLVEPDNESSVNVKAYAIATHYKKDAQGGPIREFVGSYDLHLVKGISGWKIDKFAYRLKYMTGNLELT
jgi:hypothetical protein